MKISKLIEQLTEALGEVGDVDVKVSGWHGRRRDVTVVTIIQEDNNSESHVEIRHENT